jgi:Fic family protein
MYQPKFTISNDILKNIGLIEAAREVIENAPLIPSYEKSFQDEALVRTVHFGTHLEGNELSLEEARKLLEGPAVAKAMAGEGRDVQEVINYRRVMEYIGRIGTEDREGTEDRGEAEGTESRYTKEQLLKIHALTVERILPKDRQGKIREVAVVAKNSQTGRVVFRYPPAVEVPYHLDDFFAWLNSPSGRRIHPVLRAGITHYVLAAIHPFVEGNGRVARAFATLILFSESYDLRRLFSLEEYFDREAEGYFAVLQKTSNQNQDISQRDLTEWLEFFTRGLASELVKVKERVKRLSFDGRLKEKLGRQVVLSDRQIRLMEYLEGAGEVTVPAAKEILPMVSEDTILRDLKDLMKKGIIKKKGKTKGTRYYIKS